MIARIVVVLAVALIAGCGGSDGTPLVPSRFLYASAYGGPNEFPASIYGFRVASSGALSPIPGSTAPTSDGGGPIAITRDSKVLYTTNLGALLVFNINADGSLTNSPGPSFSMPDTPVALVAHPTADFLYESWYTGILTVFAIDPATGALSLASSVSLGNEFIKNAAVITPDGRYLYQDDVYPDATYPNIALHIAGFAADSASGALSTVPGSPPWHPPSTRALPRGQW
jgi:hypothetical protein